MRGALEALLLGDAMLARGDAVVLALVAILSFGLSWFGASVGLVLGQLRLPILVYWLGSPIVGAATSLAISAVGALVGSLRHARAGRVETRLLLTIGLPSAVAAFVVAGRAATFDPRLVKGAIGGALVLTAAFMLRRKAAPTPPTEPGSTVDADSSRGEAHPPRRRLVIEAAIGAVVGALAALVGLLLGTLRLPALLKLGLPPDRAVGTNMAIGALTGVFASIATLARGQVDRPAFLVVGATTVLGSYLGASATGRMHKDTLQRLIAITLVGIGGWMAVEAWLP
jgi:uncharacterized membrane protein YfcA